MKLTLAFLTGRAEPHLDWLLESLAPQVAADDEIDVLVIDLRERSPDELGALPRYGHWSPHVSVHPPKPNPWQGRHRLTREDWWAKANAMNTALVLCESDYIAFTDDSCRVGPRWLDAVRRGEDRRVSVLAGSYDKLEPFVGPDGRTGTAVTKDHRREIAPKGKANCGGGWLYGCTFAMPLEWALDVNGAEEGCDSMGTEDYTLGLMLQNAGRRVDFVPDMMVIQERTPGHDVNGKAVRRTDKGTAPDDKSHAALARFRTRRRTEFTPNLRALRTKRRAGIEPLWPMPDPNMRDWYDGQLVKEF